MTERETAFRRAFDYLTANKIAGAVVELGVHRGASLALLARMGGGRRIVAVDSFQGLPEPSEHDSTQFAARQFRTSSADARRAVGNAPVEFVEAWFADAPRIGECALVHLDCDLYQSALDGLRLVDPVDGAIVLVDDFYCHRAHPSLGVRRAWTEWLAATSRTATDFDRYAWHGRAFVVHQCA